MWETITENPVTSTLVLLFILAPVVAGAYILSAKDRPSRQPPSALERLISALVGAGTPSVGGRTERWGAAASYFSLAAGLLTICAAVYLGMRQNEMSDRQNAIVESQSEAQTLTMFADALPVVEFVQMGSAKQAVGVRNVGKGIALNLCKHDAVGGNREKPVNAVFVSALENGSAAQPLEISSLWGTGGKDDCDGRYDKTTYVVYEDTYGNAYKSTLDGKMGRFCRIIKDTGKKAWNARGPFVPCEASMSGTKNP